MIRVTRHDGGVHELRLDRPPANALTAELLAALRRAIDEAAAAGARALVLSGAPGRFSGGLDIPALLQLDRAAIRDSWRELYATLRAVAAAPLPIAAAVTGHAPAGGTVLALYCDHRVAADGDFRLGLNEVQVGIALPPAIHRALVRQVGPRQAERLAVGGPLVTPAEALAAGLVDEVVPLERVVDTALAWCRDLLARPSAAMTATRRLARADLVATFDGGGAEIDGLVDAWFSPETQATLRALAERLGSKSGRGGGREVSV